MPQSPHGLLGRILEGVSRLRRLSQPSVLVVAALVVGFSVMLGLAPGVLPITATLGITALLLLMVSLTVVWTVLRRDDALGWTRSGAQPAGHSPVAAGDRGWMRPDRLLFFAGTATVVEITWRPAGLTLSDACFLASFGWCCISVLRGRPSQRIPTLLTLGVCLFAIGGLTSAIFSASQGRSLYEVIRGAWVLLLWPWTAATVLRDRRDLLIVLGLWIGTGTLDGLAAIGQTTGLSSVAGSLAGNRATGFGGVNDLGAAMGTLLVPALALALKFPARLPPVRVLQWVGIGVIGSALVLSGSVSAMAGALTALGLWIVSPTVQHSIRVAVALALLGGLLLSSVLGSSVPSPVHRVQAVFAAPSTGYDNGSATSHFDTITYAWPRIRQDPIVGIGLDNTSTLVHSGLVAAWLGGGIFALMGLLLVFAAVLSLGWWAALCAPDEGDRLIAWALVCAVVSFIVFFANQPLFFNQYGFIAPALLVAWSVKVAPTPEPLRRWVGGQRLTARTAR